jgi:predicted neutral ceramidase superfamily lipid hydrolase
MLVGSGFYIIISVIIVLLLTYYLAYPGIINLFIVGVASTVASFMTVFLYDRAVVNEYFY